MTDPARLASLVLTFDGDHAPAARATAALELANVYDATGCEALHVVLTDARACRRFAVSVLRDRPLPVYTATSA